MIVKTNMKVKTTTIGGGAQYAKVSDRIKAFRADNPRGSITTTPIPQEGGMVMFKTFILKDKADEYSAEATGHALQVKAGQKDFEKLETISVGRALALLGYSADGDIASSDEMEEFEDFKKTQLEEKMEGVIEEIDAIETLDGLREYYKNNKGLGKEFDAYVKKRKNEIQGS